MALLAVALTDRLGAAAVGVLTSVGAVLTWLAAGWFGSASARAAGAGRPVAGLSAAAGARPATSPSPGCWPWSGCWRRAPGPGPCWPVRCSAPCSRERRPAARRPRRPTHPRPPRTRAPSGTAGGGGGSAGQQRGEPEQPRAHHEGHHPDAAVDARLPGGTHRLHPAVVAADPQGDELSLRQVRDGPPPPCQTPSRVPLPSGAGQARPSRTEESSSPTAPSGRPPGPRPRRPRADACAWSRPGRPRRRPARRRP